MHGTEEKMKNFNMMKKLLALTLGAAMLLAVMTGCGKKDTAQEPADDQQQQQEEQQPAEPEPLRQPRQCFIGITEQRRGIQPGEPATREHRRAEGNRIGAGEERHFDD